MRTSSGASRSQGTSRSSFRFSLAYAFEPYDRQGRWQDEDENGNATRSDGVLEDEVWTEPTAFADATAFAALLADDPRVPLCTIRTLTRYAWGRPLLAEDECDLAEIAAAAQDGGGTFSAAVRAIV